VLGACFFLIFPFELIEFSFQFTSPLYVRGHTKGFTCPCFLLLPIIFVVFGLFHGVLFRVSLKLLFFHHFLPSFPFGALFADFPSLYLHITW
jgi:hypothetical protein